MAVNSQLDDALKFSLPSLVALASDNLFTSDVDRKCCRGYLEDLLKQLQIDDATQKSVFSFFKRSTGSPSNKRHENPHIDPFVQAIKSKLWIPKSVNISNTPSQNDLKIDEKSQDEEGEEKKEIADEPSTLSQFYVTAESKTDDLEPATSISSPSPSSLNSTLDEDLAVALISCLIVTALVRGRYDARVRTVIRYVVHKLRIKWDMVEDVEDSLVEHFKEAKIVQSEEEKKELEKSHRIAKIKRIAAISAATIIGGVAIGVTGGLAAPAVFGAVGGAVAAGGFGAFMVSTGGAALVGSLFGAVGAGLSGYKMNRRVGAVEEFEFVPLTDGQQLHLAVALPGWLSSEQPDCRNAYYTLSIAREQYCLKFESKYLLELGNALDYFLNIASSSAVSSAATELAKQTAVGSLQFIVAWPSLLMSAANVIDNPWSVCLRRAAKAGEHLAEVLLKRQQGHRPLTLIGFSLGARAIFYALREMSRDKHSAYAGGIIQNVILLGAPVSAAPSDWQQFSRVVAGEIINGYSRTDWLLKFLYRTTNAKTRIAGLGQVEWNDRRMFNIDLSHIISGHGDYLHKMDLVLCELGIGERRKATLMSLADSRRLVASASATFSRPIPSDPASAKRSATSSLAIEQLQLAEKILSEETLNAEMYKQSNGSIESVDSAHEACEEEFLGSANSNAGVLTKKDTVQ